MSVFAVRPCLRELSRDRAFPAWLLGPVLFVELYLFALSCLLVARWLQSALADTQPAGELPDAGVFSALAGKPVTERGGRYDAFWGWLARPVLLLGPAVEMKLAASPG
jgi:hypothetical protein